MFVAYIVSGFLAHPDWGAAAEGLVVPSMPLNRDAVLVAVATVGTTLAPWGLAFIQSYAVDKRLHVEDLRYERVDVIVGAVLTGVIGLFVVVACAATLHAQRHRRSTTPRDAARALEPLAGGLPFDPVRPRLPRRRAAGRGDRAALDRLLGRRGVRRRVRHRRQLRAGAALLLHALAER